VTVLTDTQVVTASGGLVELGHLALTSAVTVTSTGGQNVGGSVTAVCDGSPIIVEMFCPYSVIGGYYLVSSLYVDGSFQQRVGVQVNQTAPFYAKVRLTPSAGSHTFQWSALVNASSGTFQFDPAPTTNGGPGFLRVSKIVQATQWPAVTTGSIICTSSTRPASPFAGQQIYETDTSKSLIYNGTAWVQTENLGAWTTYTPTLTNIAVGTGGQAKNEGRYIRLGSLVMFEIQIALGTSGGSVSGVIGATLPPITQQAAGHHSFSARMRDAGTAIFDTLTDNSTIGRVEVYALSASGTYASGATTSSTVPFTWAANDEVFIWGFYEAAA